MKSNERNVSQLPLEGLWDAEGFVDASRIRDLGSSDIVGLLRSGKVGFVVADIGDPLKWIAADECYDFWKVEVKQHLVEPSTRIFI